MEEQPDPQPRMASRKNATSIVFFNVIRISSTRGVGIAVMGNATKYDIDAVAHLATSDRMP